MYKEQLIKQAQQISEEEGQEIAFHWLIDNIYTYYKEDIERLERKVMVRDRLLFRKCNNENCD